MKTNVYLNIRPYNSPGIQASQTSCLYQADVIGYPSIFWLFMVCPFCHCGSPYYPGILTDVVKGDEPLKADQAQLSWSSKHSPSYPNIVQAIQTKS